jgi:hypothetical protein
LTLNSLLIAARCQIGGPYKGSDRKDPIAFNSDCREGISGTCSLFVNGVAHEPLLGATDRVPIMHPAVLFDVVDEHGYD